jgi:hypothetical protein
VWLIRSPFDCVRSLAIHDHDSRDMVGAAIRDTLGPEDFGLPDIDNRWEWCCWYYATINWLGLQFCLRDRNSMLVRIEEMNDHDKRMVVAERLDREADNDGFPTKVKGRDWSKMPKEKTMHHWPLMDAEIWNRINQILSLVYGREPEVSGGSI